MARVILHIGAHKTATSFLQATFYRNRALLARHGLIYPAIGPNDAHHALAGTWLKMPHIPASFYGPGGPDALWDRVIAAHARNPGCLFLSAETFSRIWPQAVPMADLAKRLAAFEDIRIVYTVRRQADLIPSVWAQIARSRKVSQPASFVRTAVEARRAGGVPIDHNASYERILAGFAPAQIHLLDYADFAQTRNRVLQVFLDLAGVSVSAEELVPAPPEDSNISPDPLAIFLAQTISRAAPPPADLVSDITGVLRRPQQRHTTLLSRAEYAKIAGRFAPSNARLAERVQDVQPGFRILETDPPATMLYRDEVGADLWAAIAGAIYDQVPTTGIRVQVGSFLRRARRKLSMPL